MSNVQSSGERRNSLRFDKVFPVVVESPLYGFCNCIARNISKDGIFLESRDILPLGSNIRIYFSLNQHAPGIAAQGEVKRHYIFNFGSKGGTRTMRGFGVRFTHFEDDGMDRLNHSLKSPEMLH